MALELNGTTGVSLVQDGVVTAADLASGAITASALPAGSVLQVVQQQVTTPVVYTSNDTDSGFNPSITPSSTSSKILIMCSVEFYAYRFDGGNELGVGYKLKRSIGGVASDILEANDSGRGGMQFETNASQTDLRFRTRPSIMYLDSPNTTSEVTYLLSGLIFSGTVTMHPNNVPSQMVLMEIAG